MIESITTKLGLDPKLNLHRAIDNRVSQLMDTTEKTAQFQSLTQPELDYLKTLPIGVLAQKAIRLVELKKGIAVLKDEEKAEFAELQRTLDQAFAQNNIPEQQLAYLEEQTAELSRKIKAVKAKHENILLTRILNSNIATIFGRSLGTVYSYTLNPVVKLVINIFQRLSQKS